MNCNMAVMMIDFIGPAGRAAGWQERALCAQTGPDFFFPVAGGSTREAKQVCRACEERVVCLEYALENDERFGVWGGLSEKERHRLRKQGNDGSGAK